MAPIGEIKSWIAGQTTPVEKAVAKLEKAVKVTSPRRSNVIAVSCDARDPELAQRILQAYLESYQVMHVKANRTSGSYDFFVDQSELVREQLTLANEELRDAKNKHGLASVDGQRTNIEAQANSIELALLQNERAVKSAEAKIEALKQTLSELPEQQMAEQVDLPSNAVDVMRSELYKVQIQEKEASSRYTALHPTVIALRRQVEDTRNILSSEESRATHKTQRVSPVHQAVQQELAAAKALAAANKADGRAFSKQPDVRPVSEAHLQHLVIRLHVHQVRSPTSVRDRLRRHPAEQGLAKHALGVLQLPTDDREQSHGFPRLDRASGPQATRELRLSSISERGGTGKA
jgi:uncharacterized protein involved in exopolysaccharide biosynthesis